MDMTEQGDIENHAILHLSSSSEDENLTEIPKRKTGTLDK